MTRLDQHQPMPPKGWPSAPCHHYMIDHPAHGWMGPVSGRMYWCGPGICQAARDATDRPALPPEATHG